MTGVDQARPTFAWLSRAAARAPLEVEEAQPHRIIDPVAGVEELREAALGCEAMHRQQRELLAGQRAPGRGLAAHRGVSPSSAAGGPAAAYRSG